MSRAECILHDENSDVADVKVNVIAVIKSVWWCRGCRGRRGRKRKDLIVALLKESEHIREEEISRVHVFLDRLQRRHRPGGAVLRLARRSTRATSPEMQEASQHFARRWWRLGRDTRCCRQKPSVDAEYRAALK